MQFMVGFGVCWPFRANCKFKMRIMLHWLSPLGSTGSSDFTLNLEFYLTFNYESYMVTVVTLLGYYESHHCSKVFLSCCSNSVNIYVGIGIPWLIDTTYNYFAYREPLRIESAEGLSFSLLVFFSTSVGCISILVLRRLVFGAELGGPRLWAWISCAYFILLWLIFVTLSSLKVSGLL